MLRLALPDSISRDAIDDAALALGLHLVNIVPRTETHPAQVIYLTPDRQALIHFVDAGPGALAWAVRAPSAGGDDAAIEGRWASALSAATIEGA